MVQCFAANCNHRSDRERCKFFRFPKNEEEFKSWERILWRKDRHPRTDSRVCDCHFKDKKKENGPFASRRNIEKEMHYFLPGNMSIAPHHNNMQTFSDDENLVTSTTNMKLSNITDEDNVHREQIKMKQSAKKSTSKPSTSTFVSNHRQPSPVSVSKRYSADRFLENFDPESSNRERRKLTRKVNAMNAFPRRPPGAVYDHTGVHIATGLDLCDCLAKECPGCHFACSKCGSSKCGPECRVNRKFSYEVLEYEGSNVVVENPLNNLM